MGCSPSKGQLFPGVADGVQRALLPGPPELGKTKLAKADEINNLFIAKEVEGLPLSDMVENHDETPNKAIVSNQETFSEIEVKMTSQVRDNQCEDVPEKQAKKTEKRLKSKAIKQGSQKQREINGATIQGKVDLPIHMVRAHQAAYEYLKPNISKCENLLSLLDQATQNQLSLRPMTTAIVMHFEEVTQTLEKMAEEGERMLKEHGDHMAWPSETKAPAPISAKRNVDTSETPPDLLQLLLQHSTEKMKLVGSSIQSQGDTALEEAVGYFAWLSKQLGERLQAKQAVEGRLAQVLARVEAAARCNLDDLSLHSDDSGFGGENESLTGADCNRRQRGSSGSGGSTRPTPPSHSPDQVCLDEDEEEEEDQDEEEEDNRSMRARSNSSPPDPIQTPKHSERQPSNRPQTAASSGRPVRPTRSQSRESLHQVQELQHKDLAQRVGEHTLRTHSLGAARVSRHVFKENQTPSSLPALTPQPSGRNTVQRLINSFSGTADGRPGQRPPGANLRGSRRSGTPLLPCIGSSEDVVNGNRSKNSWPVEGREDLDLDNLPPPPPEVLMDNSYESTEEDSAEEDGKEEDAECRGHPLPRQRSTTSQRLRDSVQRMDVLPNRVRVGPVKQDSTTGVQRQSASERDQDREQADYLYRQARKIIHLRNAAESSAKKPDQGIQGPLKAALSLGQRSSNHCEGEYYHTSVQPTLPPVSRVRLPPSCPSMHHRLPSPPAYAQPNPPSRPSSPRVLRWSRDNSGEEDISHSVSFNAARSVFCQNSQSNSQTTACSSTQPRPYGDYYRGRMSTRGSQTVSRRSQSDQRPSMMEQGESSNQGTPQAQTRRSLSSIPNSSTRMVEHLVMEEDNQSNQSAVDSIDMDHD